MRSCVIAIAVLITLASCFRGDTKQSVSLSNQKENLASSNQHTKQNPKNTNIQVGLSEAQRKAIFDEFSKAEWRVMKVVERKYPLGSYWQNTPHDDSQTFDEYVEFLNKRRKQWETMKIKRKELRERLLREPNNELAEKHNLRIEQLNEIIEEGRAMGWAVPKLNLPIRI